MAFRASVAPIYSHDRFDHYLIPLVFAGVVTVALCSIVTFNVKRFCLKSTYCWTIPLLCAGYILFFVFSEYLGLISYTISFVGFVGLQLCFLTVVPKFAKSQNASAAPLFLLLFAGISLGIVVGSIVGVNILKLSLEGYSIDFIVCMVLIVVSAVLNLGVDLDDWKLRSACESNSLDEEMANVRQNDMVEVDNVGNAMRSKAEEMALEYGLSAREEEILVYLLRGRSRSWIRDKLVISLNTVNTHVRNIFAKTEVHSHQQLLTLAHDGNEEFEKSGES